MKLLHRLEELPVTLVSGGTLLISFLLSHLLDTPLPIYLDPAWCALLLSGTPILVSAVKKLLCKKGLSRISTSLLISLAMIAAAAIGDIFAAGEVAFIMALGEILEEATTKRAKRGLTHLTALLPASARVLRDGEILSLTPEELRIGDILRILPGETVAADGEIVEGEASFDESVVTGEAVPKDKTVGDKVFCGTQSCSGSVDIRVTSAPEDTSLMRLIRILDEAEKKEASVSRTTDKWASILVPVALLIALVTGMVKWALGAPDFLTSAVTVLVVFCPCALVLATPTAIMAAIGQAARHGVIVKSGEALEKMGNINTVALDKTGTLTRGVLSVSDILSFDTAYTEEKILALVASAEARSEHPIASAIVGEASERKRPLLPATDHRMLSGRGVTATVEGISIVCGSEKHLSSIGISLSDNIRGALAELASLGKATMLVAADGVCIGILALSDTPRENASDMLTNLHKMGVNSILLTGDNRYSARYIGELLGVGEVRYELLPEEKVEMITRLSAEGHRVAMVGDGVNDAPALSRADVGIAMGAVGSDLAIESADIALMSEELSRLPYLIRLSRATVRTIRLGIALSLGINLLAIVLSILGVLTPTTGALVHNLGSLFVILIAALLYDRRFE